MPRLMTSTIGTGDQTWIGGTHGIYDCRTKAPDPALFSQAAYPTGVPSGTPVGLITATGLVGPYTGDSTDEAWTFTEGGSGLTSWTFTWGGNTSDPLDDDATAADVQVEADAIFGAGNVTVTGGPLATGPFTFTVNPAGGLANSNLAQPTTTPTGGSGSVTVATTVAGGADGSADGREVLYGYVYTDQKTPAEGGWPILRHGFIVVDRLPVPNFATTGHNTSGLFTFETGD